VTDENATPIFERGDVVYGDDPFKGEDDVPTVAHSLESEWRAPY